MYEYLCSHWSLVDVPLIFFCPADHVPDWQPRVLLGMVEARSVNVKKTTTTTYAGIRPITSSVSVWRAQSKPLWYIRHKKALSLREAPQNLLRGEEAALSMQFAFKCIFLVCQRSNVLCLRGYRYRLLGIVEYILIPSRKKSAACFIVAEAINYKNDFVTDREGSVGRWASSYGDAAGRLDDWSGASVPYYSHYLV